MLCIQGLFTEKRCFLKTITEVLFVSFLIFATGYIFGCESYTRVGHKDIEYRYVQVPPVVASAPQTADVQPQQVPAPVVGQPQPQPLPQVAEPLPVANSEGWALKEDVVGLEDGKAYHMIFAKCFNQRGELKAYIGEVEPPQWLLSQGVTWVRVAIKADSSPTGYNKVWRRSDQLPVLYTRR